MASASLSDMALLKNELPSGLPSPTTTLVDLDSSADDRLDDRPYKRKRSSRISDKAAAAAAVKKSSARASVPFDSAATIGVPVPVLSVAALPITPPASPEDVVDPSAILARAVHVLNTEAAALSHVSRLYTTDSAARSALQRAVEAAVRAEQHGGKVIVCGVGKSGYVAMKIAATMKSLGVRAAFMHAAEALHGDLGDVRDNDIVLFVSYSGKTSELTTLSSHIPPETTVLALTAHNDPSSCPILAHHAKSILLPAPIHESEQATFGVSAPTTSTTVAIAVGDMLALTIANQLYQDTAGVVFQKNHPGGSIGQAYKQQPT